MENADYLNDLSKCVRCGSCKAYCPTYDTEKTETMGARGRLTLLRELSLKRLRPTPLLIEKIFSCTLCEACVDMCPGGVRITEDIYHGRSILLQDDKRRRYLRFLTRLFIKYPDLGFKLLQMFGAMASPYLERKGYIPSGFNIPEHTFRNGQQVYKPHRRKGRVAVFAGCSTNFLYPSLGTSLVNVLLRAGYEVIVPAGEVCCGLPLRGLGFEDEARELAKKNMRIFGKLKVDAVLSLCPSCILSIKKHYPWLIGRGITNAMDVPSFLLHMAGLEQLSLFSQRIEAVTYHDPCHLLYGLGIKNEPRDLLGKIGVHVIERKGDGCCGFAGLFSISYKDISNSLLKKQAESHMVSNASAVVTACPGCMLHLSKAINNKPVLHIVELIEEAYCSGDDV